MALLAWFAAARGVSSLPAELELTAQRYGLGARGLVSSSWSTSATDDNSGVTDDGDDLFDDDDALVTDSCIDFLDEVRTADGVTWDASTRYWGWRGGGVVWRVGDSCRRRCYSVVRDRLYDHFSVEQSIAAESRSPIRTDAHTIPRPARFTRSTMARRAVSSWSTLLARHCSVPAASGAACVITTAVTAMPTTRSGRS